MCASLAAATGNISVFRHFEHQTAGFSMAHINRAQLPATRPCQTFEGSMRMESEIEKVLRKAPVVTCPGCQVQMVLRNLEPAAATGFKTGVYRCFKCGMETQRQFKVDP
jgi:hypothetical protein